MDLYPDNVVGRYKVKLPYPLELENDHQVALAGLVYPVSWYNFPDGRHYSVSIKVRRTRPAGYAPEEEAAAEDGESGGGGGGDDDDDNEDVSVEEGEEEDESDDEDVRSYSRKIVLRPGHYATPDKVMDLLNTKSETTMIRFTYSPVTQKVNVKMRSYDAAWVSYRVEVVVSADLAYKLGWPDRELTFTFTGNDARVTSPGVMNLLEVEVLYVNCDMASASHVVGSSLVPLLKTVAVHGKYGHTTQFEPRVLDWFPVRHNRVTTVEVLITDSTGRLVPFERGRCSGKLHLRRRGDL